VAPPELLALVDLLMENISKFTRAFFVQTKVSQKMKGGDGDV
jgi:hypothetical protein